MLKTKFLNVPIWIWVLFILIMVSSCYHCVNRMIQKEKFSDNDIKIYNFNTDWCGYSKRFQKTWDEFITYSQKNMMNIKAIDVKCDDSKNKELCKKYPVPGYPTVVAVVNNISKIYDGPRTVSDLTKFAKSL